MTIAISEAAKDKIKDDALLRQFQLCAPQECFQPVAIFLLPRISIEQLELVTKKLDRLTRGTETQYEFEPESGKVLLKDIPGKTLAAILEEPAFVIKARMARKRGQSRRDSGEQRL